MNNSYILYSKKLDFYKNLNIFKYNKYLNKINKIMKGGNDNFIHYYNKDIKDFINNKYVINDIAKVNLKNFFNDKIELLKQDDSIKEKFEFIENKDLKINFNKSELSLINKFKDDYNKNIYINKNMDKEISNIYIKYFKLDYENQLKKYKDTDLYKNNLSYLYDELFDSINIDIFIKKYVNIFLENSNNDKYKNCILLFFINKYDNMYFHSDNKNNTYFFINYKNNNALIHQFLNNFINFLLNFEIIKCNNDNKCDYKDKILKLNNNILNINQYIEYKEYLNLLYDNIIKKKNILINDKNFDKLINDLDLKYLSYKNNIYDSLYYKYIKSPLKKYNLLIFITIMNNIIFIKESYDSLNKNIIDININIIYKYIIYFITIYDDTNEVIYNYLNPNHVNDFKILKEYKPFRKFQKKIK